MINVQPLREQIYAYLRDDINKGNLRPGELVNTSEISRSMGISKTPLREALIQLECDGFVTILPRRGVMVNRLTLSDVREFWEICRAFESEMMDQLFGRIDEACIVKMEEINSQMKEAMAEKDTDRFYYLNTAFHDAFLSLSDNRQMLRILKRIKQRLYDFLSRSCIPEWETVNCDEHDHLIVLLRSGCRESATTFLRDIHWSFKKQEGHIRRFYKQASKEEAALASAPL
ncbi:GntR family transcriptional regulator [Desulfoluna sp.]|uniref:GntR family transcriptional regulator n=1 Tax=Desulfoluna sp. TaxID=2045199 RepID=UPI00261A900E|nr:GntR family transcriptional regulator [Desulfoluna sp.]